VEVVLSAKVRSCDSRPGCRGVRTIGRAAILNALNAARKPNDGGIVALCSAGSRGSGVVVKVSAAITLCIGCCGSIRKLSKAEFLPGRQVHVTPRLHADTETHTSSISVY
jgi:hypothetical protein